MKTLPSFIYLSSGFLAFRNLRLPRLALVGMFLGLAATAQAASGTWTLNNAGNWGDGGNWALGQIADGAGSTADFSKTNITSNRIVTINGTSRTVGSFLFGDSTPASGVYQNYTIASSGGATLTFDNGGSGATIVQNAASGNNTFDSTLSVTLADNLTVTNNGASVLSIAGAVSGGFGITVNGASGGTFRLTGASNTFTGGVTVNSGTLGIGGSGATAALGTGTLTLNAGSAIYAPSGNVTLSNASRWNGDFLMGGGQNITLNGAVTLGGDVTVTNSNRAHVIGGVISGAHKLTFGGAGGSFTLNAANTYSGDTEVVSATLRAGNANAIPNGAGKGNLVLNGGASSAGTFDLNNFDVTINGLSGTSNTVLGVVTNSVAGARTLTLGAGDASAAFAGVIQNGAGSISLVKTGTGTQTLSGANTYTGTTSVSAGTLLIAGTHTGGGNYTVGAGATLAGTGTVTGALNSSITLASGAKLAPGASAGTFSAALTGTGNLDISAAVGGANSGALVFELGAVGLGTSDMVSLTSGALVIGSGDLEFSDFSFTAISGFGAGTYTLFDTTTAISGSLGGALTGTIGGLGATLSISGNDLVLTVVPEPAASLLLAAGLTVLVVTRRRSSRGNRIS